jgi:formate-dependent nitrite reductase membrane component NrfD
MLLALSFWRRAPQASIESLERTDRWAMLLELLLLIAFVASLGSLAPALIASFYGILLIAGTLVIGVIIPLVVSWRTRPLGPSSTLIAAVMVLVGGFILRYAVVMAGQDVTVAGR